MVTLDVAGIPVVVTHTLLATFGSREAKSFQMALANRVPGVCIALLKGWRFLE